MTSPIDRIRQIGRLRRISRRADSVQASEGEASVNLPVPVAPPAPAAEIPAGGPSAYSAHIMAQGEQARGLRGGASTLETARSTYNQVEYSGRADRRARKGGLTKTDV